MSAEKKRRGRPVKDTMGDFMHGVPGVAMEVLIERARLGTKRGSEAEAIRRVADARCWDTDSLKKAVQRAKKAHPDLPDIAANSLRLSQTSAELLRRVMGITGYLLDRAGTLPAGPFLRLLRAHNVDGTCPMWLAAALRNNSNAQGSELMELIKKAAPPHV